MLHAFVHMALIPWDKDRLLETYSYTMDRRFPCLRVTSFKAAILSDSSKELGIIESFFSFNRKDNFEANNEN